MDLVQEWRLVGFVLEQYNGLERAMIEIITVYLQPSSERRPFLEKCVMHTTVVPFAAKVKLIRAIAREIGGPQIDKERLHRIMGLRNALVHFPMLKGVRMAPTPLRDEDAGPDDLREEDTGIYLVVETASQDLRLEEKSRHVIVADAMRLIDEAITELAQLKARLALPP